jgi:predicted ATP-grasp superfamily ATP-dependent carboligase
MRDALCRDLAGLDIAVEAAASTAAPAAAAASPVFAERCEAPADFLARVAGSYDAVWLVAPESDGIAFDLTRRLESDDIALLGCRSDAIELAGRKSRCLAHLSARDIAVVSSWPLPAAPFAEHAFWVVKPDIGCGCEDVRRLTAADAAALCGDETIAQPWLEGQAMSLSLLVADACAELLAVNRQHIGVAGDGRLSLTGISRCRDLGADLVARLEDLGRDIATSLPGLAGFVGVDFILTDTDEAVVLEVNPRPTSAYVGLSAFIGRNVAGAIMTALAPQFAPLEPCIDPPLWSAGTSAAPI